MQVLTLEGNLFEKALARKQLGKRRRVELQPEKRSAETHWKKRLDLSKYMVLLSRNSGSVNQAKPRQLRLESSISPR